MSDEKLKPCAHCGEVPMIEFLRKNNAKFRVIACECGIKTIQVKPEDISRIIKTWNARVQSEESDK